MQQSALSPRILPNLKAGQAMASPAGHAVRNIDLVRLRFCIFAYFFLWVFEGVLRKWVLPSLANPLLLVRDPIVLYIYYLAFRMRIFPRNIWVMSSLILTTYMTIAGIAVLGNFLVPLYGWRTVFLHFPLIWVIATVFEERQMRLVERFVLLLTPLLAGLMMMQFVAPSSSWINAGASENSAQLTSAMGHVRPAATFSFVSGPIYYFALASVFLINSQLTQRRYSVPMVIIALFSTLAASAVCGSRAMISYIAIVFAVALLCGLVLAPKLILNRPQLIGRWVGAITLVYVTVNLLLNVPVIQTGVEAFQIRISNASATEGGAQGFTDRYFDILTRFVPYLSTVPPMGYGLGLGTNVGAVLMTGEAQFVLGEDEWSRNIIESGPLLGLCFVLWRIGLAGWLLSKSVPCALRQDPLPLLFFAAVAFTLLNGNIGQPTTLGFVVFTAGLCLASVRLKEASRTQANQQKRRLAMTPALNRGTR